jgi:plastocyanin
MRISGLGGLLAGVLATAFLAGCGGSAGTPPTPSANNAQNAMASLARLPTTEIAFSDATATVGVRLSGENPFTTHHYGKVLGYFKGTISKTSEVVILATGTNVVFKNVDTSHPHTVSFLGDATKMKAPWPAHFNGSSSVSTAGTAIGTPNFSTGPLSPGTTSLVYTTGSPGFYMVGCAFHYDLFGMRTVIIVK